VSENILVIKLGALGDFIQAAAPFASIRAYHHRSSITLLTTSPFAEFALKSHWFDDVWVDQRPKSYDITGWLGLRSRLKRGGFTRVYDLQTSSRSGLYFRLFWPDPAPDWSGIAGGCTLLHDNPARDFLHTVERQAEQLAMAGLPAPAGPDFSWVQGDVSRFNVQRRFVVLAPGGAPHRPAKRWPVESYHSLAIDLASAGLQPVVVGSASERSLGEEVLAGCDIGHNLAGQTSLEDLFLLARDADGAVGNDTGPMHIFAAQGCHTLVLYSNASDPALCAQRGETVTILRRERLQDLSVKDVVAAFSAVNAGPSS
jgi:ADP-heptose:LPS heptosyltransferase